MGKYSALMSSIHLKFFGTEKVELHFFRKKVHNRTLMNIEVLTHSIR
jgi:hypothetical protein